MMQNCPLTVPSVPAVVTNGAPANPPHPSLRQSPADSPGSPLGGENNSPSWGIPSPAMIDPKNYIKPKLAYRSADVYQPLEEPSWAEPSPAMIDPENFKIPTKPTNTRSPPWGIASPAAMMEHQNFDIPLGYSKRQENRIPAPSEPRQVSEDKEMISEKRLSEERRSENGHSVSENKQTVTENKQSVSENRQPLSGNRQSLSENRQSLSENRHSVSGNRQSLSENRHSVSENRHSVSEMNKQSGADKTHASLHSEDSRPTDKARHDRSATSSEHRSDYSQGEKLSSQDWRQDHSAPKQVSKTNKGYKPLKINYNYLEYFVLLSKIFSIGTKDRMKNNTDINRT